MGDGGTTRGINENNTVTDLHGLLSVHMPAYADSIYKGVSTVMVSYSSWNGEKMHANTELITGYLKGTLKFKVCLLFSSSDVSHGFNACALCSCSSLSEWICSFSMHFAVLNRDFIEHHGWILSANSNLSSL